MMNDNDDDYDKYREYWSEKLEEVLRDTIKMFVETDKGYYKGNVERFVQHTIATLEQLTGTRVSIIDGMVLVKRNKVM